MSLLARLAPHLPYIRRYARALTGDQQTGDHYVRVALEALAADPGNHVCLGVVLPVLPRCGVDRRFDSREPFVEELGDCASRGPYDSAAVSFAHRVAARGPCFLLGGEAALADPRIDAA